MGPKNETETQNGGKRITATEKRLALIDTLVFLHRNGYHTLLPIATIFLKTGGNGNGGRPFLFKRASEYTDALSAKTEKTESPAGVLKAAYYPSQQPLSGATVNGYGPT